jgi:hypothetical protein
MVKGKAIYDERVHEGVPPTKRGLRTLRDKVT